jgi:5-methylcytosine-specific restriction endonuclease McrA
MPRCAVRSNLGIHHIRRDGGNGLENAEVLCQKCHKATATFPVPGKSPVPFDQETKVKALRQAGGQCQCARTSDCH